jgi:anti-sigma factor RsiW
VRCEEARDLVLERQGGPLEATAGRALEAHLASCPACTGVERAERALTDLLASRLPRDRAPAALVRRVARLAPDPVEAAPGAGRSPRWAWIGGALAAAASVATIAIWTGRGGETPALSPLEAEAVNDHLRLLVAQHPLEIESGGPHQVKPWFEGKLDFAPVVPDLGGAGLALRGGAVGYFHDRRAAIVQYQLRAHLVTLVVFPAEGLALPEAPRASPADRGFHAVLWRAGPLGYALVADVDPKELERVAAVAAIAVR